MLQLLEDAVPGHDHPERQTVVDVEVPDHSGSLMSWVRRSRPDQLFLLVAADSEQGPPQLAPGAGMTVVWRGPEELRALPVELTAQRDVGDELLWEVRPTGRAVRAQRREAVRAPLAVRLQVDSAAGVRWTGATLDLSEGGLRCGLHVTTDRPEVGAVVTATVQLDDGDPVRTEAEVVRCLPSGEGRAELSLRFIGLPERHEDRIRALVFGQLRELRRRGLA